mgnify:FL=1
MINLLKVWIGVNVWKGGGLEIGFINLILLIHCLNWTRTGEAEARGSGQAKDAN